MNLFSHSGKIGDIIYSLNFCRDLMGEFDFHIKTNTPHEPNIIDSSTIWMSNDDAMFLKPLLDSQPYINEVTVSDDLPDGCVDLDMFRNQKINYYAGDIRNWYYGLAGVMLPRNLWEPTIFVRKNSRYSNKIVFSLSRRYVNCKLSYGLLREFKDDMIFLGTEDEYKSFCSNYFEMPYAGKFNNLLEIAKIIKGCKLFISNQNGLYSIAEGLKIPRILLSPEYTKIEDKEYLGSVNILPIGGQCCTMYRNDMLLHCIRRILGKES